MSAPTNVRSLREQGVFELEWPDGRTSRYRFPFLRRLCPCAECVDEFTGRRKLDPATVSEDVAPVDVKLVGNYALGIQWSDGHHTGLYTWNYFEELRPAAEGDLVTAAASDRERP